MPRHDRRSDCTSVCYAGLVFVAEVDLSFEEFDVGTLTLAWVERFQSCGG